jgi:hypothetical protein
MSPATVPTNQHFKLAEAQRKELSRRIGIVFSDAPKEVEATGNSKPLASAEKSQPVADWWIFNDQPQDEVVHHEAQLATATK